MADLVIPSLRGGMNDTDPPNAIADDQCVEAVNVEWFDTTLGERRAGTEALDVTDSGLDDEDGIVHLTQWFPTNQVDVPELWAIAATPGTSVTVARRTAGVWEEITPADPIDVDAPDVYNIVTQALNGKLFFAYHSAVDRLHVWDPETGTIRVAGLSQPVAAPTAMDEGVGLVFTTVRYYRVRFIEQNLAGDIVRRSEPSDVLTFTPSGAGAGATVTRPALLGEGETHWELEASTDNANFYIIQTVPAATTTFNDETTDTEDYADLGELSEDIGDNTTLPSAKYLAVDGDRLLLAGHWTDETLQSTVWWTPVQNDPGVGNDERLPADLDNTVSLDNYEGGPITGISAGANGTWYAFKWNHIYKFVRTGDRTRAYDVLTLSKSRGALPGSIFSGVDEHGAACIYFWDPMMGPSQLGPGGLQVIKGLRRTQQRVNLKATNRFAFGIYYPKKQQALFWLAADSADVPSLGMRLQVTELRPHPQGGLWRGWSLFDGLMARAQAVTLFNEWVTEEGVVTLSSRPFIGLLDPDFIQRCDTGGDDNGEEYTAVMLSKPFMPVGLLNKWGGMTCALLAYASSTASVAVKLIRNFGTEENRIVTGLESDDGEEIVNKVFDDLYMSETYAIQVEFRDP